MSSTTPQTPNPSPSIQTGTKLLLQLIEEERSEVARVYQRQLQDLHIQLSEAKGKISVVASENAHLQRALEASKHNLIAGQLAAEDAQRQSERTKATYEKIKQSLEALGMTCVDDAVTVTFKDDAARVVANVYEDAKRYGESIPEDLQNTDGHNLQPSYPRLSSFIDLVGKLMERSRQNTQLLEAQCQSLKEQLAEQSPVMNAPVIPGPSL